MNLPSKYNKKLLNLVRRQGLRAHAFTVGFLRGLKCAIFRKVCGEVSIIKPWPVIKNLSSSSSFFFFLTSWSCFCFAMILFLMMLLLIFGVRR